MAVRRMLVAGRYRLHEPVGSGGMGRVWMARDEMLDRDVAVKEFVPPDWMTDEEKDRLRDRTLREARSAARLNHPHVVRIYDVVHADGLPWIVMEYVPSRSLHQVIAEDGPFLPEDAARIGLDVLDALTAAHRAGVLHRDVKPHNVLMGIDGRVVLTDFGLATFVDDGSVTGPGLVVGSPQYVSPERARDGASTVESDLWSFGATLYAAVEGRSPYARESAMATLMALATESPDPPVLAGPLTPVLTGLLQHEPEDRFTAVQVAQKLRSIVRTAERARAITGRAVVPAQRTSAEAEAAPPKKVNGGMGAALAAALPDMVYPTATPDSNVDRNGAPASVREPAVPPVIRRSNQPHPAPARSAPAPRTPTSAEETPAPISVPPAAPEPRRSRRRLAVAALTLVALLGGGVVASYLGQSDDNNTPTAGNTPIGAAPMVSSPSVSASTGGPGGFSPLVCNRIPAADAPRTPQPGAKRELNGWELMSGFSYFADPVGFRIGVPDGWTYEKVGTTWCFHDPDNIRILSFDPARNPKGDALKACRAEETRLLKAKAMPSYEKIGIDPVPLLRAADWEFRYQSGKDTRLHALTRWFVSGDKAYALGWVTRDFDWGPNKVLYDVIVSSFSATG